VRVGLKTLVPLAFCAAASAAAAAHFFIDVVGDYVLNHDSYDHLHHGSRELVGLLAVVLAVVLAVRGFRTCCEIAARNRSRIRTHASPAGEGFAFLIAALGLSVAIVPSMEWLDGSLAGVPVLTLGDAFGGSLLLGLAATAVCALVIGFVIYRFARWLISHRDSIAAIIETLLHTTDGPPCPSHYDLARYGVTPQRRRALHALALSKRGPPEMVYT
jgi:hypothetical protein